MGAPLPVGDGWAAPLADFDAHLRSAPSATTGQPLATSTRRTLMIYLRRLSRDLGCGPWEASADQVEAWAVAQTLAADGPQKARLALHLFYAWAVSTGRRVTAPVELAGRGLDPRWSAAVEGYASTLAQSTTSPATQATYVRHVRWLAASVTAGPGDLEVHELEGWFDGQQWSEETRRKVLVSLRSFYRWALSHGVADWSPLAGLQSAAPGRRGPALQQLAPAWREPVESFQRWLRAGKLSEGTVTAYRWKLMQLSYTAADPWAVTTQQLETWLANPDWGPSITRNARTTLRQFYRWAVRDGRLSVSPAEDLRSVRVPRDLPRPTSDDALRQALAGVGPRGRMILLLATLAGLRRAEIASLHLRDVSRERMHIKGKGGRDRILETHPLIWEEICAEVERRKRGQGFTPGPFCSPTGYLFPSDRTPGPLTADRVGFLASRALPGHWTLHSLRHRFATTSYAETRDLLTVQQAMGHSKPETTSIYAQVPDGAMRTMVHSLRLPE